MVDIKKLMCMMFVMIFMISVVSAGDLMDFDNYDRFIEDGVYGKIEIWDMGLFNILEDTKLAESDLTFNTDVCLSNCKSDTTITLYERGELIRDIRFINEDNKEVDLKYDITYKVEESFEQEAIDEKLSTRTCWNDPKGIAGVSCEGDLVYYNETVTKIKDKAYNVGEIVDAGTYEVTLSAKKDLQEGVDWQINVMGVWHEAWAWWNGDWEFRKEVNITGGASALTNFTVLLNVSYVANMQNDFDDIRFVDGACDGVQDTEIYYELDYKVDGSYALVHVKIPSLSTGTDNICMYYGNVGASSGSDPVNSWDGNYEGIWHFNDVQESLNAFDLTQAGTITYSTANGVMGRGASGFSESNMLTFADDDMWAGTVTWEMFVTDGSGGSPWVVAQWVSNFWAVTTRTGQATFNIYAGGDQALASGVNYPTQEFYMAGTDIDGGATTIQSNLTIATGTLTHSKAQGNPVAFGSLGSCTLQPNTDLKIDEARVSSVVRTEDWKDRTYDNLRFDTFSFGAEELNELRTFTVVQSIPANNTTASGGVINFGCNYTANLYNNISSVTIKVYDSGDNLDYSNTESGLNLVSYNKTWNSGVLIADTYSWYCLGLGDGGMNGTTNNFTLNLIATNPNISIEYPTNTTYTTIQTEINYTVQGADNCEYSTDGGEINNSNACADITGLTSDEGSNTWMVKGTTTIGGLNQSYVTFFVDSIDPVINIVYPVNYVNYTDNNVGINYTIVDTNLQACWYSNSTGEFNTTTTCGANITAIWDQGTNVVDVWANDSLGNIGTDQVTFYVDSINPNSTLVTPVNNTATNVTTQNFTVNVSDAGGLDNTTLWIYNATGVYYNETIIFGSGLFSTVIGTVVTLVDGAYTWFYDTVDIYGNEANSDSNNTLTIDTINPNIAIVTPANNNYAYTDYYNVSLNWSIGDTNLNACWYYNGTANTTVTCGANATIQLSDGAYTLIVYGNDTANNLDSDSTSYKYRVITSSTYESNDPVVDGDTVTYGLWVNITNTPDVNAVFKWNNVDYTPTESNATDYTYFEKSIVVPEGTGNATGELILWNWTYTIPSASVTTTTTLDNTTVYNLSADDCSGFTTQILNLSLKDEEGNTFINASAGSNVEIDVYLFSTINSSINFHYYNQYTNDENPVVCIPDGILNVTNLSIDFTIGLGSTDHVNEFFYLDNGLLQNDVEALDVRTNRHINLMDLLTVDSTSFLFNYFDLDGLAVSDAMVHVYRKYIGDGLFREVERAKSDTNGDTIVHLVEEDVIYTFQITQYGVVLFTSSTYTALCQAVPCTIQLEASGSFIEFNENYDLVENGAYSITIDDVTRTINLTYSTVISSEFNVTVYEFDGDGGYEAIASDTSTGTGGSAVVTVPLSSGNSTFFASIYQDNTFLKSQWVDMEEDASTYLGVKFALFLAFLIVLALGLMAVSEGGVVIVWVVLGLIFTSFLGLTNLKGTTGIGITIYLILAGAIILAKINGGRNR